MTTRSQNNELMQALQSEEETLAFEQEIFEQAIFEQEQIDILSDIVDKMRQEVAALRDEIAESQAWLQISPTRMVRLAVINQMRIQIISAKTEDGRLGKTPTLEIWLDRIWTPCHQPYATKVMKLVGYPDGEIDKIDVAYDLETDGQMLARLEEEKEG